MTKATRYPKFIRLVEDEADRVQITENGVSGMNKTTLDSLDNVTSKSDDTNQVILNRFEEMLRYYHLQPRAFRDKMRQSGTVVGGFSALSLLLEEKPEKPLCLDIFTTEVGSGTVSSAL